MTGFRWPRWRLGIGAAGAAVLVPLTVAVAEEEKVCVVDGRLSVADAVEGCRPGDVVAGSFAGGVGAEGPAAAFRDASLRSSGVRFATTLQGGLPAPLRPLRRGALPRRFAALPPRLVRVRHHSLPVGSALAPQPVDQPQQQRPPRFRQRCLEPVAAVPLTC